MAKEWVSKIITKITSPTTISQRDKDINSVSFSDVLVFYSLFIFFLNFYPKFKYKIFILLGDFSAN